MCPKKCWMEKVRDMDITFFYLDMLKLTQNHNKKIHND